MSRKKENIDFSVILAEFVPAGFKPGAGIEFIPILLGSCFHRSDGMYYKVHYSLNMSWRALPLEKLELDSGFRRSDER